MEKSEERNSKLAPLSTVEKIHISIAALNFFHPMHYEENCKIIKKDPAKGVINPLNGFEFLKYLDTRCSEFDQPLKEPMRYRQKINELLRSLVSTGLLTEVGPSQKIIEKDYYYFHELTSIQSRGYLFLARTLGPSLLDHIYSLGTYQVTGITADGDVHAGTGIAIAKRWLLTCAHVVNDMTVDEVQRHNGHEFRITNQLHHPSIDVALLETDSDLHVVPGINFQAPTIGERIYTYGYPRIPLSKNAKIVMQAGEVSVENMTSFLGEEFFLFSAISRPGNSGGPILSQDGHVVGIVTKELFENGSNSQSFHAGISTPVIDLAIRYLTNDVKLPIENWQ